METNLMKKTEDILRGYNDLIIAIEMIKEDILIVKENYEGCEGIVYTERVGKTNKFNSSVEQELIEKEKKIKVLIQDLENKKRLKNRIDAAIKCLRTKEEKDLIKFKYINTPPLSWEGISRHLRYNKDYCRKELAPKIIKRMSKFIFYIPEV